MLDDFVGDGSCLHRLSLGDGQNLSTLPVYVAVVPVLSHRMAAITRRLGAAGAPDVTFVTCANREDIQQLPPAQRACLHPHGVRTEWTMPEQLANGTLSLAVKHTIAFRDLLRRRLAAALMLEDDALVPAGLWASLAPYAVPCDVDIFWLTAYRQNMGVFALGSSRHARPVVTASAGRPAVYARLNGSGIVSAAGFVVFARAAATMLSQRITAPADIALSCLSPTVSCCTTKSAAAAAATAAAAAARHAKHLRGTLPVAAPPPPLPPPSCECSFAAPTRQYGPARWLFGQDNAPGKGLAGGSHHDVGWKSVVTVLPPAPG